MNCRAEKTCVPDGRAELRALSILGDIRQTEEWEILRRQIYKRALRFADKAVFDFRPAADRQPEHRTGRPPHVADHQAVCPASARRPRLSAPRRCSPARR